jgi:hypothetical protein
MQIEQQEKDQRPLEESNAYSLFIYAVRSQITRDYYLRRLRIFLNYINLLPGGKMQEWCNLFAISGIKDPNWAFSSIVKFLQFQKERVEREELSGAQLFAMEIRSISILK